ncbi:MAG: SAM-dependent methyltransferase, partial [Gammaproteobacteria bacterium]
MKTESHSAPLISLALLSASALGTELYLVRLFAIIQWHHAAYMIISLALLGYGISGSVLALSRNYLLKHFKFIYPSLITVFALILPTCLWIVQRLDFNAELLLWRVDAWAGLAGTYLLLTLPFLVAAMAIGLVLDACRSSITRLYAADLTGAGIGALTMVMFMQVLPIDRLPVVLVILSLFGAAIALMELRHHKTRYAFLILAVSMMLWFLPDKIFQPQVSEFKPLSQTLRIKDTQLVQESSGPLGLLSVVKSPTVPFRHAPGLSFSTPVIPGEQLALFHDAGAMSAINRIDSAKHAIWFDWMPSALPYHTDKPARVLIAGAGGGMDAQQALMLSEAVIDIVEPDHQHIELIRDRYGEWSGLGDRADPRISFYSADIREYLSQSDVRYDLIILAGGEAGTAGLQSLDTRYAHTVNAYREYLYHLTTDGHIVITSWLQLPPRTVLKQVASAAQALRENGIANPGNNLMLIRSLQT